MKPPREEEERVQRPHETADNTILMLRLRRWDPPGRKLSRQPKFTGKVLSMAYAPLGLMSLMSK